MALHFNLTHTQTNPGWLISHQNAKDLLHRQMIPFKWFPYHYISGEINKHFLNVKKIEKTFS